VATHIVPILPKESFGVIGLTTVEAKRRSPSELAEKLLRIVVVQSSAIANTAREEAALQEPENWKNTTEFRGAIAF